jgi:hypothetical protein
MKCLKFVAEEDRNNGSTMFKKIRFIKQTGGGEVVRECARMFACQNL